MTVLLAFLHSPPDPQSTTIPWHPKPLANLIYFFFLVCVCDFMALLLTWFSFICTVKNITPVIQLFWVDFLLAFAMLFRWNLRLQDPRAECSLRGCGSGQVHRRGGHPHQREAGLRAAEGAHFHHPSLRLRRGSWWRQYEEIPQVSQALLVQRGLELHQVVAVGNKYLCKRDKFKATRHSPTFSLVLDHFGSSLMSLNQP